jgi:hypothetical protein
MTSMLPRSAASPHTSRVILRPLLSCTPPASRITLVDPATPTAESAAIKAAVDSLAALKSINAATLEQWTRGNPQGVPVLGLTVGLSQEKLKNALKQHIGTTGWVAAARERPSEIVAMLDAEFGLVESLKAQIGRDYSFGDVLVARAGTRVTAVSASTSGRVLEDRIEAIAIELGLTYETRTGSRDGSAGPHRAIWRYRLAVRRHRSSSQPRRSTRRARSSPTPCARSKRWLRYARAIKR